MKKIQIYIEHDIIIRHFLLNNTFEYLESHYKVQYVFPKNSNRIKTDLSSLKLQNYTQINIPNERIAKLREFIKVNGVRKAKKNKDFSFLIDIWKGLLPKKSYLRLRLFALPLFYSFYQSRFKKNLEPNHSLQAAIDSYNPNLIIHPCVLEGLFINDLITETKKKNIPMITLMNSWDNPSTKATVSGIPETLVVWGEQTKNHAMQFMEVPAENIHVLGPAQFEVYRKPPTVSRLEYCEKLGISPDNTLILYAGSSKSFNEINHLKILNEAIESGTLKNTTIIFKPHPWRAKPDHEPYFFDLAFKNVIMDPQMVDLYNASFHSTEDGKINLSSYQDTHNILSATDLLISNVSTILLEAALHGQPVLCMVSDEELKGNPFLKVVFRALYFREIMEKIYILRCNDHNRIASKCSELIELSKEENFKAKQIERTKYFVEMGEKPYGQKLLDLVEEKLRI